MLKYKYSKSHNDFIEFKKAEGKCRVSLRTKKRESFKQFSESLGKQSNPSQVWKIIKSFKNRWYSVPSSHQYNFSEEQKIKAMIDELCPSWIQINPNLDMKHESDPFLDLLFTRTETDFVISQLKVKSSPGLNGIDYNIIHFPPPRSD